MRIAYKFLEPGAVSPFTRFEWPGGAWVSAPADREASWIFACRRGDLPYWIAPELWRIELGDPVREGRHQLSASRARLLGRVDAWNAALARDFARACALRARDLALPALPVALREDLARLDDLNALAAAVSAGPDRSAFGEYLGDAAVNADQGDAAATAYVASMLAATVGAGEAAFEGERAWQARWLSDRLRLREP